MLLHNSIVLVLACQALRSQIERSAQIYDFITVLGTADGYRVEKAKMILDLAEVEYQRFWKALQQLGLNAYEARTYLVLLGHSRFKALELAPRSHVPRQKIYEVLDSLVEKGFPMWCRTERSFFQQWNPILPSPLTSRVSGS